MDSLPDTADSSPNAWLLYGSLFVLVTLVYLPSIRYGFLDDETIILFQKPLPKSAGELLTRSFEPHFPGLPYFRPVPHASYLIQAMRDQNSPGPFHVFNALLMGATTCSLFLLLNAPALKVAPLWAWLAAVLVAVHPASSSTVIPIVGRETLMCGLFTIAALACYLHSGRLKKYAFVMLALGLLSKEQCVIIPALFVLADWLGLREIQSEENETANEQAGVLRRLATTLSCNIPAFGITGGYLVIRGMLFRGSELEFALFENPTAFLNSFRFLVQTVFAPYRELMYEPYPYAWASLPRFGIGLTGFTLLVIGVWKFRPLRSAGAFWLSWMVLSVLPTANILKQQAPFSERYVFLAIVACAGCGAGILSQFHAHAVKRAFAVLIVLVAVGCSLITHDRGQYFSSQYAFAEQWEKTNPEFIETQMSIGWESFLAGDLIRAERHYRIGSQMDHPAAHTCLMWVGKIALAMDQPAVAKDVFSSKQLADDSFATIYRAVAWERLGQQTDAIETLREVKDGPQFSLAQFLLKRFQEAEEAHKVPLADVFDFRFTNVTDADLADLVAKHPVRALFLSHSKITGTGLKHLRDCRQLEQLELRGTRISDADLRLLRGNGRLRSLGLGNTRITDACVDDLISLPALRRVDVRYTELTAEAIDRIATELPLCRILYEPIPAQLSARISNE